MNKMKYKDYIKLGFKRHDLSCSVEFDETGYYGFSLEKKVSKKISICVNSGELDKPKLYISKRNETNYYHIIPITCEIMLDLLIEKIDYAQFHSAA